MITHSLRHYMGLIENAGRVVVPTHGWLNISTGEFAPTQSGHMATVVKSPTTFGFASLADVVAASEYGTYRDISRESIDRLCSILDGDEGLWQTLYDRGWIRVVYSSDRFGIVVEDTRAAWKALRLLTDRFAIQRIDIDLYDRATQQVRASFNLTEEEIDAFLRHARLRSAWRSGK